MTCRLFWCIEMHKNCKSLHKLIEISMWTWSSLNRTSIQFCRLQPLTVFHHQTLQVGADVSVLRQIFILYSSLGYQCRWSIYFFFLIFMVLPVHMAPHVLLWLDINITVYNCSHSWPLFLYLHFNIFCKVSSPQTSLGLQISILILHFYYCHVSDWCIIWIHRLALRN